MNEDLRRIMSSHINDNYINLYVCTLVKGVINIHNLLNNRIRAVEEKLEYEEKMKKENMKKEKEKKEEVKAK